MLPQSPHSCQNSTLPTLPGHICYSYFKENVMRHEKEGFNIFLKNMGNKFEVVNEELKQKRKRL